jgi:hypothetical protein
VCSDAGVVKSLLNLTLDRLILIGAIAVSLPVSLALPTLARADETVMVCDIYGNHLAARPASVYGIRTSDQCPGNPAPAKYTRSHPPGGLAIWTVPRWAAHNGERVQWTLRPPAGLLISSVYVPHMYSYGIDNGTGWRGGLIWGGGSNGVPTFNRQSGWSSANSGGPSFVWPVQGTRSFGWRVACRLRRCRKAGHQWLSLELVEIHARETKSPDLVAPDGLWQSKGWIRGWWVLHFFGDSPTGLCATGSTLDGQDGPGSVSPRDSSVWHQCAAKPVDQPIDTSQYGQGIVPLSLTAIDAAGQSVTDTRLLEIDNQQPTISLSGPTEASSASGTQYIHAAATAGPSGVAGIECSTDGEPARSYPTTTAAVPVNGVGEHHLSCYSQSNARDASGKLATSAPAIWTLNIRSPSVSTVSFVRIADALRCVHRREQVRIPGHWENAYHHGHRVRVWVKSQRRRKSVVQRRPRVVYRRIRRDGHWTKKRTVLLPHRVDVTRLRVRYGKSATVRGWLGTPGGHALGGQTVRILVAADNGAGNYRQISVARTRSDGVWRTHLRPGPSRLVQAEYAGSEMAEPSVSKPVHLGVPASLRLRIHPTAAHWDHSVAISGGLRGGYIPPAGEIVVLWVRWRGGSAETGHLYVQPGGRFNSTYSFRPGTGHERYTFWAVTLRESDYPYAPARSNRVRVKVSP